MLERTFPSRGALRRLPVGLADIAVFLGVMALLYLLARVSAGTVAPFAPPRVMPGVSLDPRNLPYYAARSTLRMFVALGASLVFTLAYGYVAAHSRRAERAERANAAIDLVGLDGFESAYPKELSGGVRQRVGRAGCASASASRAPLWCGRMSCSWTSPSARSMS